MGESTFVQGRDGRTDGGVELRLLVMMVSGGVMEFDLSGAGEYAVGRSPTAHIHVDSHTVSRNHATIVVDEDGAAVRDLGSTNGTFVNGQRVGEDPVRIQVGDAIAFGEVAAQLRRVQGRGILVARIVPPPDFDARVLDESDRAVRFDRPLAFLALELSSATEEALNKAKRAVVACLRPVDTATVRGPARLDLLVPEASGEQARQAAERVLERLRRHGCEGRFGLAAYPQHVPTPESLPLAAEMAMGTAEQGGMCVARDGARVLQIGRREVVVAEPAMARLYAMVDRVAASNAPVLIQGETGSGKEIVAEAIHTRGPRCDRPLVRLNCAALPESLLESELFGHERGAFSGAERSKPGLFEQADGGSLFLDEIGDMAPSAQAKLLRVLEDGMVRRVGATSERQVDVRIIAASHKNLKEATAGGRFRHDLFFRLSALTLSIPPLRERPREIPLLVARFAAEAGGDNEGPMPSVSAAAMEALVRYPWPGNVRELRNAIGAAMIMSGGGEIEPAHLSPEIVGQNASDQPAASPPLEQKTMKLALPLDEEVRAYEQRRIVEALEQCDGNQTRAAELLKIPRRTLVYKLTALGIETGRRGKQRGSEGP